MLGPVGWLMVVGLVVGAAVVVGRSPRWRSLVGRGWERVVRPEASGPLQRVELGMRRSLEADTHATLAGVRVGPSGVAVYAPAKQLAMVRAAMPELRRSLYGWLREELGARVPASFEILVFETGPTTEVRFETWHEGDRRPGPVRSSQSQDSWGDPGDLAGQDTVLDNGAGEETVLDTGTGEETVVDAGAGEPWVVLRRADGQLERLSGSRVRLGRAPQMDLSVDDPRVSRHHATLTLGPQGAWVEVPAMVTNQLRVDGVRTVAGVQVPVRAGTRLELSRTCTLTVEDLGIGALT
jgi:hypothetical protein